MTFEVQFDLDDKSLVLHDTSAAAAEAAADRAEAAAQEAIDSAETLSGSVAQIAENKNDISLLTEDFERASETGYYTLMPDMERGWINTSGQNSPDAHTLRTIDYIEIDTSHLFQIFAEEYYTITVKAYDENKNYLYPIYSTDSGTPVDTDFKFQTNVKYIRYALNNTDHDYTTHPVNTTVSGLRTQTAVKKDSTDLQNTVDRYGESIIRIYNSITNTDFVDITNQLTLLDGYIDNHNGNLVTNNDAKSTDYLNIYEYGDLYVTGSAPYPSTCLFAIYDANQTFLGYHKNGTETNYHFRWFDVINDYPTAQFVRFASITAVEALAIKRPSTLSEILSDFSAKKWSGKKWVCIGDSLTEANIRTTKHYYDYVSDETGITVVINAGSGSGYMNPSSVDNKTFYERAAEIPTDADVVTVFGSGNDLTHGYTLGNVTDTGTETICGCINATLDALITRMPTIQLGIVAPTPWVSFPPSTSGNAMELYVEALQTICKNRSIPFLDLYHCSNLRPWTEEGRTACYSKDGGNGVHPDEIGHKIIAPRFSGLLKSLII